MLDIKSNLYEGMKNNKMVNKCVNKTYGYLFSSWNFLFYTIDCFIQNYSDKSQEQMFYILI